MHDLELIQKKYPVLLHENYLRNILFLCSFSQVVKNKEDACISYNYSAILKLIPSTVDCDEKLFIASVKKLAQLHLRLGSDFSIYDFVACVNESINPLIKNFETDYLVRSIFCKVVLDMLSCDVLFPVLQGLQSSNAGYVEFLQNCYADNASEVNEVLHSVDTFLNIQK